MLVGYLTIDEVNFASLARAAADTDIDLIQLFPREWVSTARFDAIVVDLDFLLMPLDLVLRDLLQFAPSISCVVHGHHLQPEEQSLLRAHGVRCIQGFDSDTLLHQTPSTDQHESQSSEEFDESWDAWIDEASRVFDEGEPMAENPANKENACDPSYRSVVFG